MLQDQQIICLDCRQPFTFTDQERAFFERHALLNTPRRCKPCRARRRLEAGKAYPIRCADCGAEAVLPFKPDEGPVYCGMCHRARQGRW